MMEKSGSFSWNSYPFHLKCPTISFSLEKYMQNSRRMGKKDERKPLQQIFSKTVGNGLLYIANNVIDVITILCSIRTVKGVTATIWKIILAKVKYEWIIFFFHLEWSCYSLLQLQWDESYWNDVNIFFECE